MWLMKVGERVHLEQLRSGKLHFSPLSLFRSDGTSFRGDKLEGKDRVDTSKGLFVNGADISKIGSGLEVTYSYAHSDDILIFCAAALDKGNVITEEGRICGLKVDFLKEIREFGKYGVLFSSNHFVDALSLALDTCNYGYRKVSYIDKWDFDAVSAYYRETSESMGDYAIFFLKDTSYKKQNEWRFVIDDVNGCLSANKNGNGSLDVYIPPFPTSDIIDLDDLYTSVSVDEIR